MEVIIWIIVGFLYGVAMRVCRENRDFNKKRGTKMRNIDKIRQMNPDELAEFIEQACKASHFQQGIDVNNIRNWLEQESED